MPYPHRTLYPSLHAHVGPVYIESNCPCFFCAAAFFCASSRLACTSALSRKHQPHKKFLVSTALVPC